MKRVRCSDCTLLNTS